VALNILLDLDGTLTDPFPGISRCIIHALEKQGIAAPDREILRSWIGPTLLRSFSELFEQQGQGDAEQALSDYRERFGTEGLFENTVYEGVTGLLAALSEQGHRMFLATAKPVVYARRIVDHFGLNRYLSHTYGSELDGTRTDKVDLLQYIVDQEDLDPGECAMVGDRKHDMIGARYHGMKAIGVLWGYGSREELLEAGAEHLAESPGELLNLL
jgi:phosphoglycolate phosphatase